ncbi:hypothetical protein BH10ACT9_BH10ACT9_17310 [soil metagenome]
MLDIEAQLESIELDNVSRTFGSIVTAVDAVHLHLDRSRIGVVGESGSGKTTLGRILLGLDTPTSGRVLVNGVPLADILRSRRSTLWYRSRLQYVGQDSVGAFEPGRRMRESVLFAARYLRRPVPAELDSEAEELAEVFALDPALFDRYPGELSGGQRQRMALIRGLLVRPQILVCDEAVSALDVSVQAYVLNELKSRSVAGAMGLVFITHGLPACAFLVERLVVMLQGRVVEAGPTEAVLGRPESPYTRELLTAYQHLAGG